MIYVVHEEKQVLEFLKAQLEWKKNSFHGGVIFIPLSVSFFSLFFF